MKESRHAMFHSTETESQFLFYKTDESLPVEPDETSESGLSALLASLTKAFPDVPYGPDFIDRAIAFSGSAPFCCALAVKMDGDPDETFFEDALGTARIIADLCEKESGLWGGLGRFLFACIFPEKNGEEGLDIAKQLQKKLTGELGHTATIGIACHPVISFEMRQVFDNAQKALAHAAFFGPDSAVVFDAVSLNISGDHFYQQGDVAKAMAEFETALELDPENVNVHNSFGVCLGHMGDFDKALTHFDTASTLAPDDPMAWYNTGLVHKLKKDNDRALEFFLKAGETDRTLFEAAFQAGKIYFEKDLPELGNKYYQKAIDLKPGNNLNYRFLGECYTEMDRVDDAVAAYKKAVLKHPNDAAALSALGCLFDKKGENPEIAALFCRQSVDISPQNGLFRHRLGELYEKQDEPEKALYEFKKASDLGFDASAEVARLEAVLDSEMIKN
jgi:tetratricopeptide (TPR) repeat protein